MKQVDFKRIEIENFLSVGNETVAIDFKTGLNIITGINNDKDGSRNGVGKTTIADALFYCLFGETIRELKKEEIVNNINQKKCRVKLDFEVSENGVTDVYSLERKIAPTKLALEKNGGDVTESSMVKTTERVSKIIGANADVFRHAVIMTVNGTVPFMAQSKVEKRKFCEGLFNLGMFQDMLLESRKRYNDVKASMSIEQTKLDEVNSTLAIYNSQKKRKDDARTDRITVLLQRESDNIKELADLEGSLITVNDGDATKFQDNIKLLEAKLASTHKSIRKCIGDIATKEEQLKTKIKTIKELKQFGDKCDKCSRLFTDGDKKDITEKITALSKEQSNLKTEIEQIYIKQKESEDLKEKCILAIEKQKSNIVELNTNIERNKNSAERITQLRTWNTQIKIDIEQLNSDCNEFDVLVNDTSTRMNTLKSAVQTMEKRLAVLDSVKYIVSEEGVKSYIIKKVLNLLNSKLAYYLNKIDAPCRFKFNEYFGEQIINEKGQECSYNNFSSGEKKRIDLAILFTFMDIRRLQGNTAINIAFYDEVLDTSIDDKGIEMFLNILNNRVDEYNESCYIISHKSTAIKAATNDIIFLEKTGGFTTIGKLPQ